MFRSCSWQQCQSTHDKRIIASLGRQMCNSESRLVCWFTEHITSSSAELSEEHRPVLEGPRWWWTSWECSWAGCMCIQSPWCHLTTRRCGWYVGADWLRRLLSLATLSLMQMSVTRSCSSSTWWSRRRVCSQFESSWPSAATAPSSASQSRQSAAAGLTEPISPCRGWCHEFPTVSAMRHLRCTSQINWLQQHCWYYETT